MGCDNVIFRKGKKPKSGRRHAADPYAETQPVEATEARLDKPGPYDGDDVDTDTSRTGRIDFGSLQVRPIPGTQLLVHSERNVPRAVLVRDQQSMLDLRAFAAPRNSNLWDDLRQEMAAEASKSGGMVSERRGPYGIELEVTVPVQTQDGRHGTRSSRLLGIDGPRWFLRVQIWGAATNDAEAARPLFATLADLVVVRGRTPMAPRDFLPITVPEGLAQPSEPGQQPQPTQGQQAQGQQAQGQARQGQLPPGPGQPGPGQPGLGQLGQPGQGQPGQGQPGRGPQPPRAQTAPPTGRPAGQPQRAQQPGAWRPGQPGQSGESGRAQPR